MAHFNVNTFKALAIASCMALLSGMTAPLSANDNPYVSYQIKPNDTLNAIAQRYMRSQQGIARVQRINGIRDPRRLRIGSTLRIPRNLLSYRNVVLTVRGFSGPVKIDGADPRNTQRLAVGEQIQTYSNGFVTFETSFGGRISLPSNTTARLVRARRYNLGNILDVDFEVTRGRANVMSPTLGEQDRLQMRTPLAVTAVRGTEFRIGYDPENGDASLTEVTEGGVNVAAGGEQRAAPAGFGIASSSTGVNAPEELLAGPVFIDGNAIQTGETLDFNFMPVDGAKAYRVQVGEEAGFIDIISEQIVQGTSVSLPLPEEQGRYYVRARAIAESGLEGLESELSGNFIQQRLDISGSAESSPLFDGYSFGWTPSGSENVTFAFQLRAQDNPDVLLVDELGLSVTEVALTDLAEGAYQWRVAAIDTHPEAGLIKVWGDWTPLVVSN